MVHQIAKLRHLGSKKQQIVLDRFLQEGTHYSSFKCQFKPLDTANLGEEALFFFGSEKKADHAEQLQVVSGHLDLTQGTVQQMYGQIQSLIMEMHQLLVKDTSKLGDKLGSRMHKLHTLLTKEAATCMFMSLLGLMLPFPALLHKRGSSTN